MWPGLKGREREGKEVGAASDKRTRPVWYIPSCRCHCQPATYCLKRCWAGLGLWVPESLLDVAAASAASRRHGQATCPAT